MKLLLRWRDPALLLALLAVSLPAVATAQAEEPEQPEPETPAEPEPTELADEPAEPPPATPEPAELGQQPEASVTTPRRLGDEPRELVLFPWYERHHGDAGLRALFPVYFESWRRGAHTLFVPPYYRRRGPDGWNTDVVFPLLWSYRRPDGALLVIPPVYANHATDGWDVGVAPFFFGGKSGDDQYRVVPPLFWSFWDDDSSFTLAGPVYIRNTETSSAWGLPPLLFVGESEGKSYAIAFPLFWRFADEDEGTGITVVGPLYSRHGPGWSSFGAVPVFFTASGQNWSRTTMLPLFHYASRDDDRMTLITPFFGYDVRPDSTTLMTPLYQRVRASTNMDAVAPIFWYWRRPRIGSSHLLLGPYYHASDPVSRTDVVFPVYWDLDSYDSRTLAVAPLFLYSHDNTEASTSLWIAPSIQYASDEEGWVFNVHPLLYTGETTRSSHQVLFPFLFRFVAPSGPDTVFFPFVWDFVDRPSQSHDLVLFPFFWQFRSRSSMTQVVLNSVYTEGRCERGRGQSWRFDFVPLFAFGAPCPGDTFWSVLYGLVGYRTAGRYRKMELFWLPFDLSPRANAPQVALQ